jgi:class 3 adenylate cyclase
MIVSRALTYDERFMELQIPGRKVSMIFSVCQIRKFPETTDCLLDEIIVFVNKIVKIVHECAKVWDGVPTNNNGDKYILTWKLPTQADVKQRFGRTASGRSLNSADNDAMNVLTEKLVKPYAPWIKDEVEDFEDLREGELTKTREQIADKALISAVKTMAELLREQDLQAYSKHPKILSKFGKDYYKTELTFGIHVGSSIEGSIGTERKVDALYLSPDVQIASRIEDLNGKYKTQILLSGEFYDLLSAKGQASVRQIDNVLIKESQGVHKQLWSYDMKDIDPLVEEEEDEDEIQNLNEEKVPRQIGVFIKHEDFNEFNNPDLAQDETYKDLNEIERVFLQDHDFVCIARHRNDEFAQLYEKGLQSYLVGDWVGAQMAFNLCQDLEKNDGALQYMLKLMEKTKALPPEDWQGVFNWDFKPIPPEIDFFEM